MAQVGCLQNINNDPSDDTDSCTPSKRLKQARLPFKTIDHKTQIISPKSTSASKKRKLSDAESPSAKVLKTPKPCNSSVPDKTQIVNNETEVSSSSEAENVKTRVRNTLERFVCKRSQEEITSTNTECIELSDSDEGKESDVSFVEMNTCQSKKIKEFFSVKGISKKEDLTKEVEPVTEGIGCNITSETKEQTEKSLKSDGNINMSTENKEESDGNSLSTENKEESDGNSLSTENKEESDGNISLSTENKENMNISVESISDDSSGVDPVTPGKGLPPKVLKTPVSSKKSSQSATTPLSQSPGDSLSDGTPKSASRKSRSKLSEAKQEEREALKQKIKEEKLKALEEKKKQKEEERLEKEREKEKQRLEREAIKAEKERQKKEEKEKKEKERLEKIQQKEEEQKKKRDELEAKMEEKKKKEEEKQKENEEKMKKQNKVKKAFQSFFIKSSTSPTAKSTKEPSGLFMPFQVKKDTRLAPEYRQKLSDDQKERLDSCVNNQNCSDLYLTELKKGKNVGKSRKTFPKILGDDDVELLGHDSEVVKKVTYKCKLLQFHMNYRPPYYGTWTKKAKNVGPRTPFKTDTDLLDYEYDSDDDWEEEEPGESLSDCEDEDEKDEEGKEEEGDGWMVPHGYLSDDEGVDNDEEITPELLKMRRDAKAEQWESELKRQTKAVLPQIIGCFWEQTALSLQEEISKQLEQYKAVLLIPGPVPTSHCEPVKPLKGDHSNTEAGSDTPKAHAQKKPVPEEAMPDLIRLIHGNLMGIKRLVREFRIFWKSKSSEEQVSSNVNDASMEVEESNIKMSDNNLPQEILNKSLNLENDAMETDCSISKRQLELKITAIAVREKRADFKKFCWYVSDEILKQYNCEGLPVPSAWESLSQPAKTPAKPKPEEPSTTTSGRKTPVPSITQFARPMSPSTIAAQHATAQAKLLAAQIEKKKELEAAVAEKKEAEKMEISEAVENTITPQKENKKVPVDQRKLTEFTNAITSLKPNIRRIVPTKVVEVNSQLVPMKPVSQLVPVKPISQFSSHENREVELNVKPITKAVVELPVIKTCVTPYNGMILDATGDNSKDAIVLD